MTWIGLTLTMLSWTGASKLLTANRPSSKRLMITCIRLMASIIRHIPWILWTCSGWKVKWKVWGIRMTFTIKCYCGMEVDWPILSVFWVKAWESHHQRHQWQDTCSARGFTSLIWALNLLIIVSLLVIIIQASYYCVRWLWATWIRRSMLIITQQTCLKTSTQPKE